MARMFAIDVSKWDGIINFQTMIAFFKLWLEYGIEAIFIRAGYGYNKDTRFDEYVAGAKAVGLYIFTYFYFYPQINYLTQAENYVNILAGSGVDGSAHCDFETDGGLYPKSSALSKAHGFCQRYDQLTGKVCDMYTAPYFWAGVGGAGANWVNTEGRKLWVAQWPIDLNPNVKSLLPQYTKEILAGLHNPMSTPPWAQPTWWQYTAKLTVEGVEAKDVDGDSSIPSREEIISLYNLTPPALPEPPETFGELVERYMWLETWARAQGYVIPNL